MDVTYNTLAIAFLEALVTEQPQSQDGRDRFEIFLDKNLPVYAPRVWTAFLHHSWHVEKMAKMLLGEIFSEKEILKLVMKGPIMQMNRDARGVVLAEKFYRNDARVELFAEKTTNLLANFLLSIKNASYNRLGPKDLKEAPRSATLRSDVLIRDCYQCPITDKFDRTGMDKLVVPDPLAQPGGPAFMRPDPITTYPCKLQAAHIIPHKMAYHTEALKFIQWFSDDEIQWVTLSGEYINRLENVVSMQTDAHKDYDDLLWGIEPVVVAGIVTFRAVRIGDENCSVVCGRDIVFNDSNPPRPQPNPLYFKLHLSVGRMLHECGAL